jgi:hypothetical protein
MKTAAAITALAVVGSIAYAAGQGAPRSESQRRDLVSPETQEVRKDQSDSEPLGLLTASDCSFGDRLDWFSNVHYIPNCNGALWKGPLRQRPPVDLDGDGTTDLVVQMRQLYESNVYEITDWMTNWFDSSGGGNCCIAQDILFLCEISVVGEITTVSYRPVLGAGAIGAAHSLLPAGWVERDVSFVATHDVDRDGDPDLIMRLGCVEIPAWVPREAFFWVENTASHNPPLAADLNRDGSVDGVDLGLLLAAWGS